VDELVELGLRKPGAPAAGPAPAAGAPGASQLKSLIDAFLKIFSEVAPAADPKESDSFRETVKDFRDQIALADHDQEIRRLASGAVRACEQFLRKSRHYYATREQDLTEALTILQGAARKAVGESSSFNEQVRATSDRVRGLSQLDDIRELKKRVTEEASTLERAVEEKQKRDEQTMATLTQKVEVLQAHLSKAEEEASLDPLTKIPNRGTFDRSLAKQVASAKATKKPMSLAMLDIDHFKKINDTHGHPIGDRVILCVAQWVSGALRHTDLVARYGGEEFGVIMPDADLAAAESRFQQVLQQIAARSFEYDADGEKRSVRFTVSCGVTQLTPSDTEQDLVQRADQALYDAKKQGRNRVIAKKRSKLGGLFG
jgi:diguanylate cyclase